MAPLMKHLCLITLALYTIHALCFKDPRLCEARESRQETNQQTTEAKFDSQLILSMAPLQAT